jgi:predicted transcriptional regulator
MHEVLNTASAIRATASILARTPDLEPARRGRFHTNLFQDSQRLAETIGALVAWLDRSAAPGAAEATPADALAAFVAAQDNHFPQIEAGADPETLIAADPRLPDAAARGLARAWLDRMAADARALPLAAFGAAAARLGADPLALAARFGAPLDRVLRRLASLPAQPGLAEHGLVLCDGSGMPTLRKPLPGFPVPRYGAGCPLWPLYQALLRPGVPVAAVVALPDGGRFVAHAICALDRPEAVGGPQRAEATMALRRVVDGGAGLGAPGALPIFEAGPGCRICPRSSCTARREPAMV